MTRRGSALVGVVVALIVLQLVVLSVMAGVGRDGDATAARADAARALYAAEAGMNLALREAASGTDHDGDGGVGSISDDGNPVNDPAMSVVARVFVSRAVVGADTTLTSTGRSGAALARVRVTVR
jgi:Tfp pilus assembly protein PilX